MSFFFFVNAARCRYPNTQKSPSRPSVSLRSLDDDDDDDDDDDELDPLREALNL